MGIRLRGARQGRRIATGAAVLATALGLGLGGLPTTAEAATSKPVVVGFGDSVPAGLHCSCQSMITQYADEIGGTAQNLSSSGSTSLNLVHLLNTARAWNAVKSASVVVIMTGANDYTSAFDAVSNGASTSQYNSVANSVKANVTAAVKRIRYINPNADVVVVDYWGAMEAGKVAQENYNAATQYAALKATESVDGALWQVATSQHTYWVSTYNVFYKTPSTDITGLLLSDGNHLSPAGTSLVAGALNAVLSL
jgi:lysophospholipase L1-like esterase